MPETSDPKNTYTIRDITNRVIDKITKLNIDVYVSFSAVKQSKSRYLRVRVGGKKYVIRISDHPIHLIRGKRFDFDIYVGIPRPGALHYKVFNNLFGKMVKNVEGLAKICKRGES